MREGPLHAAVKAALAEPGDRLEVPVGRFVIDLVRADGELVEVQTGGFGALGRKLDALLDEHRMRVVYPVAAERRIVRVDEHGEVLGVRRSPKRATAAEVFDKLVAFPSLLTHPNLTIEVLLLREDHIRRPQPTTTRGRTRDPGERRMVEVLDRVALRTSQDILAALPALPVEPFSTRELAALLRCSTLLAQRTLYCLRTIGIVEPAGKRGRAPLHAAHALTEVPGRACVRPTGHRVGPSPCRSAISCRARSSGRASWSSRRAAPSRPASTRCGSPTTTTRGTTSRATARSSGR